MVEIAVSVFRVPGIHHREVKSDKDGGILAGSSPDFFSIRGVFDVHTV